MITVVLSTDDEIQIEFDNAEEVFLIKNDLGKVIITQVAGFEVHPSSEELPEDELIYESER